MTMRVKLMNEEVGFTAEELCVLNESQIKGGSKGYVPSDLKCCLYLSKWTNMLGKQSSYELAG